MTKSSGRLSNAGLALLFSALLLGVLTGLLILSAQNKSCVTRETYQVGQLAQRDGYSVEVNSSRIESVDEPNAGVTLSYVVVDLSVHSESTESLPFIPVFQTYIRVEDGNSYEMSPLPGIQSMYSGDIAPGDTVSGELSYYLPNIDQELVFFFDPGWNEQSAVFVEL